MPVRALPCVFMRGGTSKGLIFKSENLPSERERWDAIFLAALGSPDPNQRQLDGMGGGISSLSKIGIVGPATRGDADLDYTFAQVSLTGRTVDYSGNCGNISSAIGPYAVEEKLVDVPADGPVVVRIHNTNTGKVIHAHFDVIGGQPAVDGDFTLDGVSGCSAPIRLDFIDPAGAKTGALLPTGNPVDILEVPGMGQIEASLVDAANPVAFLRAADMGLRGDELPSAIAADTTLMSKLEIIRRVASVRMGMAATIEEASWSIALPLISMLSPMRGGPTISGRILASDEADIQSRTISVGQPHKAIPLTAALCLAAAIRTPGTVGSEAARKDMAPSKIIIAHPSGTIAVDVEISRVGRQISLPRASVFRSARRLFDGRVHYRVPA